MHRSFKLAVLSAFVVSSSAYADTDCSKVLIPKKASFQASMQKWISLLNAVNMGQQSQDNSAVGFGYAGFDLSYSDAQAASSFYQQRTKYQLAENDTLSIVSTELPPALAKEFVECVKATKVDITITAPSGSENQEAFQIKILWTPTYSVQVVDGKTSRAVTINVTNGKSVSKGEKIVEPTNSTTFNVVRDSLDKPVSISASVDGRDSDFFTFPARPQSDLVLKSVEADYGPIRRSGHYGNSPASGLLCLPAPDGSSQFLPSTVNATVTGNGSEWQGRSHIDITQKTPLKICAVVKSDGVGCNEDACYHDTTGHLSATLATITKIEY
jgi:opacity protein-like surface antigen